MLKLSKIQTYFKDYQITFDECLALGYINIQNKSKTALIDTLKINEINDSLYSFGLNQRWIQVYDGQGIWNYQQRKAKSTFSVKYIRLNAGDL